MKKVFFFLATLCTLHSYATKRTVSNNTSTIAQFNTIQAAIDAASSGDTIYVHGSPNGYAGFTINNKSLTLIGPGWRSDKELSYEAVIYSNVTYAGVGASGSELHGLTFNSSVIFNNPGINNIRFIRNHVYRTLVYVAPTGGGTLSNYLFEGNWFDNGGVISNNYCQLENFMFQNNLFYESGCCLSGSITGFVNTVNVQFDHNLWYGPAAGTRDAFSNSCRFLILSNNIFVRKNASNNLSNSVFNNNITYQGMNTPWATNGNVDGGGNIAGQDPQLAAQAAVSAGENNPLLDFTISTGPANNAGTDGKDMGLLFDDNGSLNWNKSRASRLPVIYSMNILTPTVAPGGSVTVKVEARTNN